MDNLDQLMANPPASTTLTKPADPLDAAMDSYVNGQQARLKSSLSVNVETNPDEFARQQRVAQILGSPVAAVQALPKDADRAAKLREIETNTAQTPKLRQMYTDADFAKLAHDDSGVLARVEKAFNAFTGGIKKGSIQDELGPLNYAAMLGTITPEQQARRDKLKADMSSLDQAAQDNSSTLDYILSQTGYTGRQVVSSLREGGKGALAGASAGALVGAAAGAVLPPSELLTVPGAASLGARAGFVANSAVYNYKMEAGFAYDEFADLKDVNGKPLPNDVARGAAAAVGLINAGLETTGEVFMAKLFPGMDKLLTTAPKEAIKQMLAKPTFRQAIATVGKKWVTAASAEGITEALQELSTIVGREFAQGTSGQTFKPTDLADDAKRVGQAGLDAFVGALGVGAAPSGYHAVREARQVQQQQRNADFIQAMGEDASESKLRERMPEKYRELVAKAKEGGPVQNIYIPAEQFQTFFQSQNIDPAEVAAQAGATNYTEALAAGTDVVIPVENYAATLAGSEFHQGLAQDIRLHQGDMTAREFAEYQANQEAETKRLQDQMEQLVAEQEKQGGVNQAIEQMVRDVEGQLVGIGTEASTAKAQATLMRGIAVLSQRETEAAAAREGRQATPEEVFNNAMALWDRYGLTVNRPLPEVLTKNTQSDISIDPLLDALRAGVAPTDREIFGKSLAEFVRDAGGLVPTGESLAAQESMERRPFERSLVQKNGMSADMALEKAIEAGYFPGADFGSLTEADFLNALDEDLRGNGVFSVNNADNNKLATREALNSLAQYLDNLGIDLNAVTDNAQVRKLIEQAQQGGEVGEDASLLYQSEPLGEGEVKRVLRREPGAFLPEEQAAFDEFMAGRDDAQRIMDNLEEHKGTPWAKQAVEGIFTRQAMRMLIAGQTPTFQSSMDSGQVARTRKVLAERGVEGMWRLIEADGGLMGAAAKPVNNVNSSFINCDPSADCAKYCYATKGNYQYANVIVKSELVTLAVELDPVRAAQRVAAEYKATAEFANGKALRLFDKGDGNAAWLPFIKELNKQGIRTQIFSKVPEFLRQVPEMNLRLLSIDNSNMQMADENQDLPVAFVYTGREQIDTLAKLAARNQIQVVLPVKLGQKLLDGTEISDLKREVPEVKPYLCPIDAGFKKLGKTSQAGTWNCTKCDVNGGVGCFHGNATKAVMESLEAKPATPQDRAQRILELRKQINELTAGTASTLAEAGQVPPGRVAGLLSEVDALLGELLRDYEPAGSGRSAVSIGSGTVDPVGGAEGSVPGRRVIPIKQLYQSDGSADSASAGDALADKRGFIQFGADRKFNIGLLEKANLSTFLHETGHFYLEVLGDLAQAEGASDQVKADYAAILKWLGVESRDQITTEHHEQFARANEAYLMEGNAPAPELRSMFQRFKAWLGLIYRQLSNLNVKLTNEVREVFDRIYATEQEIAEAKREVDMQPLFLDAAAAGMTEQEFAAYQASVAQATEAGKEALQAKLMRELQREQQTWWKDELAKVREEVTAEVDAQPVYRAFAALVAGKLDDIDIKLNKDALVEKYGAEYVKRLPRSFQRIYTTQGGMDADAAASFLGFDSGDKLVEALVSMRPRNELIQAEAKQRMIERHGDLMTDGTLAEEARIALHNTQRENLLMAELKALKRKQREVAPFVKMERDKAAADAKQAQKERAYERRWMDAERNTDAANRRAAAAGVPPAKAFRDAARNMIGQIKVRDLEPTRYLRAERQAAKQAFDAMGKGDYTLAAAAKQRELLNHHLYLEATKAREEADAILKYMRGFASGTKRQQMGKAGADYLDQIDGFLDRYEFARVSLKALDRRKSLAEFIAEQEAINPDSTAIPAELVAQSQRVNYREIPVDELRAVRDAVKNIEHLARLKNKLLSKKGAVEFADAIGELVASAENNGTRKPLPVDLNAMTRREKAADQVSRLDAMLLKTEQIVEWLDNGDVNGPWHTYLWNPIAQAQTDEMDLTHELTMKVAQAVEQMPKEQRLSMLDTFDIQGMGKVTRKFIVSIAMNVGNEQNLDKMMRGHGWSIQTVEAALAKLNEADIRFVQQTLDTVNSLWPRIAELEKRVTGLEPEKVESHAFEVKGDDGRVIGTVSGYYPLVYDPRKSETGAKQEAGNLGQLFEEGYQRATTPKGHTKARTQGFAAPLVLDFEQVLTQHLAKVVKDLTHREAVLSANKILTNPQIRNVLQETLGPAYEKQMLPWLRSLVNDRNGGAVQGLSDFSRWMMSARANVVAATMGFKITTGIAQITGLSQSLDKVQGKYLSQALLDYLRHPIALTREVHELSGEMRHRAGTLDRDIRDQLRNLTGQNSTWAQAQKFAFHGIAIADAMVGVPTWMGAYRQAMAAGKSQETAILEADAAVRMTQGSGGAKDLSAIQRNNELGKTLTMFYSYFNVLYNRMRDMGRDVQEIRDMPRFLARVFFTVMFPAVMGDLILGRGPKDDEDGWLWAIKKVLLYPLMSIPVLRDVASSMDSGFDYKFSPIATGIEKLSKLTTATAKLLQDGDAEWGSYAAKVAETIGYVFGVAGTAQLMATGKYLWRVSEGDEQPDNIAELLFYAAMGKRKE